MSVSYVKIETLLVSRFAVNVNEIPLSLWTGAQDKCGF